MCAEEGSCTENWLKLIENSNESDADTNIKQVFGVHEPISGDSGVSAPLRILFISRHRAFLRWTVDSS